MINLISDAFSMGWQYRIESQFNQKKEYENKFHNNLFFIDFFKIHASFYI